MKRKLESSIDALDKKLAGMKITADIAEALPGIVRGRDMKIMQLCSALTNTQKTPTVSVDEKELRDRIINAMMEISEGASCQ